MDLKKIKGFSALDLACAIAILEKTENEKGQLTPVYQEALEALRKELGKRTKAGLTQALMQAVHEDLGPVLTLD